MRIVVPVLFWIFLFPVVVFSAGNGETSERVPFDIPLDLMKPKGPHAEPSLVAMIPKESPLTVHRIALGELLFSDSRLSRNRSLACISCHRPETSFTAPIVTARRRNPPVIFNRLFSQRQFWNARAESLEDQIRLTMRESSEMDFSGAEAILRLNQDPELRKKFREVFGRDHIRETELYQVLASFVRSIVSYDSKFDRVSRSEPGVKLTELEEQGRGLFFEKFKCSVCHSGPNFTNERLSPPCYPQFGQAPVASSSNPRLKRRFNQEIKTPTLRGLAKSAPYFHNGSLSTVDETIEFYDRSGPPPLDFADADLFQVPITEISATQVLQLKAFLGTLNGRVEYGHPRKQIEN